MVAAGRERKVDFIFCPASAYISLEMTLNARAIATAKGRDFPVEGCAIFVRSDNTRIYQLTDLRGKRVMPLTEDAFFGWHAGWRELKEAGLDP
jgi:two-component system, LuxR family, sensor histidine kinase TtrS